MPTLADTIAARSRRRAAFTLTELLAVLVIVVLLLATFVPYAMSLREASNRARCTDNLRGLHIAMTAYAARNGFAYPRTRFDAANGSRWTAFTGADEADPFAATSAVQPNDVTASYWLLVRESLAQPFRFVCPSSDGTPDPLYDAGGRPIENRRRGNFRGPEHLSYSFASPFSAVPEYALTDTLPSSFVLVADQAPSARSLQNDGIPTFDAKPARLATINSVNHRRSGQNVLYASGTVQFETSAYCGVGRSRELLSDGRWIEKLDGDNIYTALAPSPLTTRTSHEAPGYAGASVGPAYRYDTFLVPGAGFGAIAPAAPKPPMSAAGAPEPASQAAAPASAPAATAATQAVPATAPLAAAPATTPATSAPATLSPTTRPQ